MRQWLEERTGIETAVRRLLDEGIPVSSGWPQVFGSVAVFLFLIQAFTGILLALNFAPTPGEAYHSLRFIISEVTGGRLIRQLHHWGASAMVIVVVAHMVQVFLYGAYKKPREATWIAGVFLLLATLAYGLTGYLLPWDNRAYWGTIVTTQIMTQAPLVGPYLARALVTGEGIGALTYARFYTMHVVILPAITTLLIVLHVYLVRRHGVTPAPGDTGARVRFFPAQAFKDTVAIFACFAVLFLMASFADVPLGRMADPTGTGYNPRPEWYFMFLFEILKFFEGPLEFIGSIVLPALGVFALILVPFIDRGRLKRVTERTLALGVVVLAGIGWAGLTAAAITSTPPETASAASNAPAAEEWRSLPVEAIAAAAPGTAPDYAISGARLYVANKCAACHRLNGSGMQVGPTLNGLAQRRSGDWVKKHFLNPQALSPGTTMPAYKFTPEELDQITKYLISLPPR